MKSSNKWLLGFGAALGLLVILAVVLVLIMPGNDDVELLPENTPKGVVQRYLYAIKDGNYEEAYSYLSTSSPDDNSRFNTFEEWSEMFAYRDRTDAWRAIISDPVYHGEKATVSVTIEIFSPGGVFSNPVDTRDYPFLLERQEGVWRIESPLYKVIY